MSNLCKDCRHARPDNNPIFWITRERWNFARCARKDDRVTASPITGKLSKPERDFCSAQRLCLPALSDHCGFEGRFFEPKEGRKP